ncbi:LPS-assembly protein LptD [Candidatus Providencia siddallii]|uniref:LPS-assembly protein LptD n=1 Tax=Candidatus Providencia siddallii TaxID=1715285 RepID=A0A0M6W9B9_9GAMM|nr:LPS-assembly protein LptD [Candidatus Providencia siddallii]
MIKNNLLKIFFILILSTCSYKSIADFKKQCILKTPIHKNNIVNNIDNLPVYIASDYLFSEYPKYIEYKGNVSVRQGNQTLTADNIKLIKTQKPDIEPILEANAIGNISYYDSLIYLTGTSAWYNLNNKNININNSKYFLLGNQSHGYADKISTREKNRFSIMENATFTTCLPKDNNWSIIGSKVIIDHKEETAKIKHARFRVGYIPIFYIPYIQLPIGNKNSSGFLSPTGKYSNNDGLEFSFPYYFNFKKNYNAIITPQFISRRGVKLNNEIHYSIASENGIIAFDFLNRDYKYNKDKEYGNVDKHYNNNRWLFYWNNPDSYLGNWNFDINFTKVSDSKYFTDFSSPYGNTTDGYLKQKFSLRYSGLDWNLKIAHKQFQIFTDNINKRIYKAEPQIDFNFYKKKIGVFDFQSYIQSTRFISVNKNNINVTRLHIEPEIKFPISNKLLSMNNNFKLFATSYTQNITNESFNKKSEKNIFRILPMFKSDIKTVLERSIFKDNKYIYTIEPHIQYVFIPYKNQFKIENFDSTLFLSDYSSLFNEKIYSGIDRIASANQFAAGIKNSLYDKNLIEKFNFSIGQIYFFKRPRVEDLDYIIKNKTDRYFLLLSSDVMWFINKNFGIRGDLKYDSSLGCITSGSTIAEYRLNYDRLLQFNYRFINHDYIQQVSNYNIVDSYYYKLPEYQQGISQIGSSISLPLNEFWNFVGSCYYDTKQWRLASQLFFLQYNTCCWGINLGYERKIVDWQDEKLNNEFYRKWSINIQIKGFNNDYHLNNQEILNKNIIPYRAIF